MFFNDLTRMGLPALVHPEPLIRVSANHILNDACKPLGVRHNIRFPITSPYDFHFLTDEEPVSSAGHSCHESGYDGSFRVQGQEGKAIGGAGGAAEKINETTLLPGPVLVDEKTQDAPFFQMAEHLPHGVHLVDGDIPRR